MSSSILEEAADLAFGRLNEAKGDIWALPEALRTLVMVYSAQGIIDNGGLEYFYLRDFPGQPPYSEFAKAYARIGAHSIADCIERSSLLFGLSNPHTNEAAREAFIRKNDGDDVRTLKQLSDQVCGDASVWAFLHAFVIKNRAEFCLI